MTSSRWRLELDSETQAMLRKYINSDIIKKRKRLDQPKANKTLMNRKRSLTSIHEWLDPRRARRWSKTLKLG